MLDSFETNEPVRELGDGSRHALDYEYFEAGVVVEVGMTGGDDQFVAGMLQLGEFLTDSTCMVVINEGNCAHHEGLVVRSSLGDQPVSDEIAERLRSVGISQPRDEIIESFKESGIKGNSYSAKDAHDPSLQEIDAAMRP